MRGLTDQYYVQSKKWIMLWLCPQKKELAVGDVRQVTTLITLDGLVNLKYRNTFLASVYILRYAAEVLGPQHTIHTST